MAHYEPPHQDLRCLQIQLFSSLVVKELKVAPHLEKGFIYRQNGVYIHLKVNRYTCKGSKSGFISFFYLGSTLTGKNLNLLPE